MRIFLIDDDSEFRNIITIFLEMRGYEVISAADPTGCAVYDEPDKPCPHDYPCGDILLIDQNMPNLSGLEFIQLQQKRGCKGIGSHKALMSANLNDVERQLAIELGCTVFRKPFRMYSLLEWIESVESTLAPDRTLFNFSEASCAHP